MSARGRSSARVVMGASSGMRAIELGRTRLLCVGLFFSLSFGSIAVRLIEIMLDPQTRPVQIALPGTGSEEDELEVMVPPARSFSRADITDRNGTVIATSLITASAFANPKEIKNDEAVAAKLEKVLKVDKKTLAKRLSGNKTFVWIKRHLTPSEQQAVNDLGIPGVYFMPEERRIYPYGGELAHVVGYVGVDNKGLAGIEKSLESRITDEQLKHEPLTLSIDLRLQHIVRDEVERTVEQFRALGGAGVIADARTGEILASVSLPDFDPHQPARAADVQKFNRVSLGAYEMGSTFKSFTTAMALQYGTVSMKGGYDASNPFKMADFTINDSHPQRRWLSVPEIFAYSSNIGMAHMAMEVGAKRQRTFMKKLGMLEPINTELPEKSSPIFPAEWKDINAVTIAYGHGISVSPLHLVRGIATIIGDGYKKELTFLKDGNANKNKGEQIVSEDVARNMRRLLRLVVTHGTGGKGEVEGYSVGGKTGTAEKVSSGGYSQNAKLTSFIGAFPMNDPRYVVLVMIDEPQPLKETHGYATGGWVAAPAASNIISRMAPLLGIRPDWDGKGDDAEKYWVSAEPVKSKPTLTARANPLQRFLHAASY